MPITVNIRKTDKNNALASYHVINSVKSMPYAHTAVVEVYSWYNSTDYNAGVPLYPEPIYKLYYNIPNTAVNKLNDSVASIGLTDASDTEECIILAAQQYLVNTEADFSGGVIS